MRSQKHPYINYAKTRIQFLAKDKGFLFPVLAVCRDSFNFRDVWEKTRPQGFIVFEKDLHYL
jgi:hypothetical protein